MKFVADEALRSLFCCPKRTFRLRGRKMRKKFTFSKLQEIYESSNKPFIEIRKYQNDPIQEIFKRDKILYDMHHRQWPKNHALSASSVDEMMKKIAEQYQNPKQESDLIKHSEQLTTLKRILFCILKNHESVVADDGYGRILKHHLKGLGFLPNRPKEKLKPIPVSAVSSYMSDILRRIVPFEFYGSNRLRKKFFREITRIISGAKNENFIFHPLVRIFLEVKTNLPWLREIQGWGVARRIILNVLKWLLLDYILLILKNHFYITDVGSCGYRLYYYRKNDIHRAVSLWLNAQIKNNKLSLVKGSLDHWDSAERKWLETGSVVADEDCSMMPESTKYIYPVAKARFLPKVEENGELRLITSYPVRKTFLKSGDIAGKKLVQSFLDRHVRRNLMLRKVKLLLQFLVEKYGTGFRPLPSNPKLEAAWKRAVRLKDAFGKLYFVKADISDAFGSILPSLLGAIIEEKLKLSSNNVMQMKRIKECRMKNGAIECSIRKSFGYRPRENSILVSRSTFVGLKKKLSSYKARDLKNVLDQIINHQYLKINKKHYRLIKGLTQGSAGSFSPLLCEIYCSEMDRQHFIDFLTCSECVLLRGADDYLLITSSIEKATKFYEIVYNGIKDFNVAFNRRKLKSNISEDVSSVQYLGLIFNVESMCVRPDYSKFKETDMLSMMKLCDNFGDTFFRKTRFLRFRSLGIMPLKLSSITLNNLYNSLSVVREIVFAACSVQANRILVLARYLFRGGEKNDLDICVVLSKSLGKITKLVARLNTDLSADEVAWLFWSSALAVFNKYSGLFSNLLVLIRYRIFVIEERTESNGQDFLINYIKKEMKSSEEWREMRRNVAILTSKSKPSDRFN